MISNLANVNCMLQYATVPFVVGVRTDVCVCSCVALVHNSQHSFGLNLFCPIVM